MSTVTIGRTQFKISETLIAPNTPTVLAYLKAAKEGKGLAEKVLKNLKKEAK